MANGQGLLSGGLANPLLNVGAGLLSVAGPSRRPQSIGTGLMRGLESARQAQTQQLENRAVREELRARAQQRDARSRLGEMMQPGQVAPDVSALPTGQDIIAGNVTDQQIQGIQPQTVPMAGIRRAGGVQSPEVMGLLSQAAPEQFTQSLLGAAFPEPRSEPSDIQALRAAGIDPQSEQGRQIITQGITGGSQDAMDAQIQALEARNKMLDLQQRMSEMSAAERDRNIERSRTQTGLNQDVKTIGRLAELSNNLRGTIAETGQPFGEVRRTLASLGSVTPENVASALGIDQQQARQIAADVQEFKKFSTDLSLQRANRQFGDDISNQQLNAVQQTSPSLSMGPEANQRLLDSLLSRTVSEAETLGVDIDRDVLEQARNNLAPPQEEPQPPLSRPDSGRRSGDTRLRYNPLTGEFEEAN